MGKKLASIINQRIDSMDGTKQDIYERMGKSAGIDADTVQNIISARINCPPRRRLSGFSKVLNIPLSSLISAAESDGCKYDSSTKSLSEMVKNELEMLI
jgi:hypothetical protein